MNQIQKSLLSSGLVFVLGAGALVAISMEKKSRFLAEEKAGEDKKLFPMKPDDVASLTLVRGADRIVVVKDGADWRLKEPLVALADEGNVSSMVGALTSLEAKARLKPDQLSPEKAGLTKPDITLDVKSKDGTSWSLWIGGKNTFDDSVYVRAGEHPDTADLATVAAYGVNAFQKSVLDLRNKRVTTLTGAQVDALEVTLLAPGDEAVSFKAVRSGQPGQHAFEDGWQLTAPVSTPADREVLAQMVNTLTGLRATDFVDETNANPARWGLEKPAATVKLSGGGKEETILLSLQANGSANKAYARRTDQPNVFEVPESGYASAFKSVFTLRDKRVVQFDRDAVKSLSMTLADGKTLTLVQDAAADAEEPGWKITSPAPGNAQPWKVAALLYSLSSVAFRKFLAENVAAPAPADLLSQHGLTPPARTVTLLDGSGKQLARLLLGKEQGGDVVVMAEGGNTIGLIDSGKLSELPKTADDIVETAVDEDGP